MPPVAPQPPSRPDPLIGVNLGGYEIQELIGAGAMGRVYRARQIALDRPVAVKILPPQFAADELSIARFRREAKAAAAIQNGHIVHVHDFGDQDGVYYYVMELIQGETLGQLLAKHTRFEQSDCIEMARQVLLGLEAAHSAGIVHRDVKPDNLMLDHNGKIKVGDLGLARSFHNSADTHLTQTGMAMGTPQYVAPEQICDSSEIDYRADFYALGATLFHLSTGRPPFPARSSAEVMSRHLNDPAPRARDHNPALSESFTELIQKLMEKMAPMRPQTHAEIYQALDRCQAGTAAVPAVPAAVPAAAKVWSPQSLHPATLPTPEPNRSRQPLIWVIAAVAAIAAGVWAYIATLPEVPTVTKTPTPEERNPTPSQETPPAKPPIPEPLTPATATKDKPAAPNLPEPEQEEKAQIVAAKDKPAPPANPSTDKPVARPVDPPAAKPEKPPAIPLAAIPDFTERLESYLTKRREQVGGLDAKYLRALEKELNKAADAGDLKLVKAFQDEKAGVEALTKALAEPAADPIAAALDAATLPPLAEGTPEGLRALRKTWTDERGKIRDDLDGKLQQSLKALAAQLTKAREFEKAQAVLAWRVAANLPVSPGPALLSGSKPGKETVIDLGDGVEMEFVWIPAGSFDMGSPDDEEGRKDNEGPAHKVTITKGFWMGRYEVTRSTTSK